jgi:hypothetical protein
VVTVCLLVLLASRGWAKAPGKEPTADATRYGTLIKPADRKHWSFQPVRAPRLPDVTDSAWVRNPIDRFVLAGLETRRCQPAAPVERRQFLRRIYLDVVGLPPTPAEQEAFLRDPSPLSINRLVTDLLGRPAYGERWARHWLDLVRYAETNGYERDGAKPSVWRYRDYVIRALNQDKPYDRFILEQLAGDELPDADSDTVIATGFYRLGPWDDEPADVRQDRFDQLDDMVTTTSEVFLGVTLGCARCHNHKFDPLTTLDYYRMVAIMNPLARPQNGRSDLDLPAGSPAQVGAQAERDRQIAAWRRFAARARLNGVCYPAAAVGGTLLPLPGAAALWLASAERRRLADSQQTAAAAERRISALRDAVPDLPRGYFLREPRPNPPVTHLLIRGRAARPGPEVGPGVPAVLAAVQPPFPPPGEFTSRRRLTLARWIASPDNPLTARVIVNRIWQYHFGEGLVRTPSDFGKMGTAPTHPELLDWLASWFVREGWSLKKLHHLILTSNTYRMSKQWNATYGAKDPEDKLLWRVPYRRLEVEAIRDSMLAVSGQLNRKMFGPSMYPHVPKEALEGHSDPNQIWPPFAEKPAARRTVYAFVKRSMIVPMLEVLDFSDCTRSSAKRSVTSVPTQALTLLNGDFVNRQARHLAARMVNEVGDDPEQQIERAYRLVLCRPPSEAERDALLRFLSKETVAVVAERAGRGKPIPSALGRRRALEQMCRVIFNLNEFVYPD